MRFFRRKSKPPPGSEEYVVNLISTIRHARGSDAKRRADLLAFAEEDRWPDDQSTDPSPKTPPDAEPAKAPPPSDDASEAEAVAQLEAYLSSLPPADVEHEEDEPSYPDDRAAL